MTESGLGTRPARWQQEPQGQVSIRPWAEDLAVIDRLVDEVKTPNRDRYGVLKTANNSLCVSEDQESGALGEV